MPSPEDPCLLPNGTLRNKLGITHQAKLTAAEADLAAARERHLRHRLPEPPFTFETLRAIHHELFQDVYPWAGEPRTTALAKREFDHPGSPAQSFVEPRMIAPLAEAVFKRLAAQDFLRGTSRPAFAAGATEVFTELNRVHFAREGNGRSHRLLLSAIARNAGHALAFDVVTRERMVATSVAAHKGDSSGVRRMFDEILDTHQVEAMRKALGFLKASGTVAWNDLYVATTRAGQDYDGTLVGRAGSDFMLRVDTPGSPSLLVGDARDLPSTAANGSRVGLRASQFPGSVDVPRPRSGSALGSVLDAMRQPEPAAPPPWAPPPASLTGRIRAFDERMNAEGGSLPKAEGAPSQGPDDTPRLKQGPKP